MTDWKVADDLDTLAAACAEAGDFDAAVKWQEKALGLLAKDDERNREVFEARLTLYRAKKPYREGPKTGAPASDQPGPSGRDRPQGRKNKGPAVF